MRGLVRGLLRRAGYDLVRYPRPTSRPRTSPWIREVAPFTLTTP